METLRLGHHPPILSGGGEKKTLRMVAQYADACNIVGLAGVHEEGAFEKVPDLVAQVSALA